MKKFILLVFLSNCFSLFAQCLNSGSGNFNDANTLNDFVVGTQGNGEIGISNNLPQEGNGALEVKVNVAGPWQVRLFTRPACYFTVEKDSTVTFSFYAKTNEIGSEIKVALMDDATDQSTQNITLTSLDWKLYTTSFKADFNSSKGRVKLTFLDEGTHFVDELKLNAYDCSSTLGGTAQIDACGVCAGGNTNTPFLTQCNLKTIKPNDPKLVIEGVLESELTDDLGTFYRFTKDYTLSGANGFYSTKRATASSCVSIRFKSASPAITAYFNENTALSDDLFYHDLGVFRDGELYLSTGETTINLVNDTQKAVEWKLVLPTYTMYELLKLEIIDGYDLESVENTDKPKYIAIGNSITHGLGAERNTSYNSYPYLVADSLGYEAYNWGIGGSKIYTGILENFETGIQPDLVSVLWGYNDVHSSNTDNDFTENTLVAYDSILNYLCTNYPQTTLLAILPTYTNKPYKTEVKNIENLKAKQLEIIEAQQATCPNLQYMYGDDYTDASDLSDDVHLNTKGYRNLADGIIFELNKTITSNVSLEENKLILYPNPSEGKVYLTTDQPYPYQLLDATGKLVTQGIYANTGIDIQNLSNGLYILKINDQHYHFIKK